MKATTRFNPVLFVRLIVLLCFSRLTHAQTAPTYRVDSYAQLQSISIPSISSKLSVIVGGSVTNGDGGGGVYTWNASATDATNGAPGYTIVADPYGAASGRWMLTSASRFSGAPTNTITGTTPLTANVLPKIDASGTNLVNGPFTVSASTNATLAGGLATDNLTATNGITPANVGASKLLRTDASGKLAVVTIGPGASFDGTTLSATGTGGTVTSVGLSVPGELVVSGSPVTGAGTLGLSWANVSSNKFLAGPANNGVATAPTFRPLDVTDFASGTGATTNTFWRGDASWASPVTSFNSQTGALTTSYGLTNLAGAFSANLQAGAGISFLTNAYGQIGIATSSQFTPTNSFEPTQFTVTSTPHVSISSGAITTNLTFNGTSVIPANQVMQTQFNANQHMNRAGISYNASQYIVDNMATDSGAGRYGLLIDGVEKFRVDAGTMQWMSSTVNTPGLYYGNANDTLELGKSHGSTNDTKGFVYLNSVPGVPSGVPVVATDTSKVPFTFDKTDNILFFYSNGAWQGVFPSAGAGTTNANTFYGAFAGDGIDGYDNAGFGQYVMANAKTSITILNSALGWQALNLINGGSENCAIGASSMGASTNGAFNVAVGVESLSSANGQQNVALGYASLKILGGTAGYNTAIGSISGTGAAGNDGSVSDAYCTFVGYNATRDTGVTNSTSITNSVAIGANAHFTNSNQIVLGDTNITSTVIRNVSTYSSNLSAPTSITVTASPFTWTNSASVTVSVYIAGGTSSEIDLNGTALGTGLSLSGLETVLLQPNETVTVTYTVAPTMHYKGL